MMLWRNKFRAEDAGSLDESATSIQSAAETLKNMLADGVAMVPQGGTTDAYAMLVTDDPDDAKKYGMEEGRSGHANRPSASVTAADPRRVPVTVSPTLA